MSENRIRLGFIHFRAKTVSIGLNSFARKSSSVYSIHFLHFINICPKTNFGLFQSIFCPKTGFKSALSIFGQKPVSDALKKTISFFFIHFCPKRRFRVAFYIFVRKPVSVGFVKKYFSSTRRNLKEVFSHFQSQSKESAT